MKIAVVQLCRFGDHANLLPLAYRWHREGHEIHWVVKEGFTDLLEACSYVNIHSVPFGIRDVTKAAKFAATLGCDRIAVAQVDGNPAGRQSRNFCIQNWRNCGCEDLYHDPANELVFDRRDAEAERHVISQHIPPGSAPLIGYCLTGHSSPFREAAAFEQWLKACFNPFRLMPLPMLPRADQLLCLIEACDLLITIDTLPLHLSFASKTPVIALSVDEPWYQSEQRAHWLGRLTYSEAVTADGQDKIVRLVNSAQARVVHVVHEYDAKPEDAERNHRACISWRTLHKADGNWETIFHRLGLLDRNSRDVGDERGLPFVRDVFDFARRNAGAGDIVCWSNTDSNLVPESGSVIRRAVSAHGSCCSARIDVDDWRSFARADLAGLTPYPGTDLFAFSPAWWDARRDSFSPDLILGYEGWDAIMRTMILESGGIKLDPPIVYHENHEPFWRRRQNIKSNPGQLNNVRLCKAWAKATGHEALLGSGAYVFK